MLAYILGITKRGNKWITNREFLTDFFREQTVIFSNKKNIIQTITTNKWYKYKQKVGYNSFCLFL